MDQIVNRDGRSNLTFLCRHLYITIGMAILAMRALGMNPKGKPGMNPKGKPSMNPKGKPFAKKLLFLRKGIRKFRNKVSRKFVVDCTHPVEAKILDLAKFEKYLWRKIKFGRKITNFGKITSLGRENDTKIVIVADNLFSKRHLKYLTMKYLKQNNLQDSLKVVESGKDTYELRDLKNTSQE